MSVDVGAIAAVIQAALDEMDAARENWDNDRPRYHVALADIEFSAEKWLRQLLQERAALLEFVAKMRTIPPLAEGHNSAHNWASMRVQEALAALDADAETGAG